MSDDAAIAVQGALVRKLKTDKADKDQVCYSYS